MRRLALPLSLALLLGVPAASAQPRPEPLEPPDLLGGRRTLIPSTPILPVEPVVDVLQPIQQVLETACGATSSVGGTVSTQLAFLCTARDIANQAVDTIEGLNHDLSSYANRLAGGLLDGAVTAFGETLGLDTVNAGMANVRRIVTGASGQARRALEGSLDGLYKQSVRNLFALDPRRPADDPRNLGALARVMNPEAAVAAVEVEARQKAVLEAQGNAAISLNQARRSAEALANSRSATDLNTLVNAPVVGRAATLSSRIGAAVSSREAIQRLGEGLADVMSAVATANSQVNSSIAALAEQNVYTLQELNALVEIEARKELAELEASQRAAEAAMLDAWEGAQAMRAMAASASRGLYAIGNDAPRGLGVGP